MCCWGTGAIISRKDGRKEHGGKRERTILLLKKGNQICMKAEQNRMTILKGKNERRKRKRIAIMEGRTESEKIKKDAEKIWSEQEVKEMAQT